MSPNTRRIARARAALKAYQQQPGSDPQADVRTQIVDLLADLFHLCTVKRIDIDAAVSMARIHCAEKLRGAEEPDNKTNATVAKFQGGNA